MQIGLAVVSTRTFLRVTVLRLRSGPYWVDFSSNTMLRTIRLQLESKQDLEQVIVALLTVPHPELLEHIRLIIYVPSGEVNILDWKRLEAGLFSEVGLPDSCCVHLHIWVGKRGHNVTVIREAFASAILRGSLRLNEELCSASTITRYMNKY
jgi:hypothetical protein